MVLGQQLFLNPFKAHIEVEAPSLGADMDFARLNFLELQNFKLQDDFIREKRDRSRLEAELEMERGNSMSFRNASRRCRQPMMKDRPNLCLSRRGTETLRQVILRRIV